MTWNGLCPYRAGNGSHVKAHEGRNFTLTINSRDAIYVNCAEDTCDALIGTIEPGSVYSEPFPEPH